MVDVRSIADPIRIVDDGNRPPLSAPEFVEAGIGRHSIAPGAEGGAAVEAVQTTNDCEESFLTGVSGICIVAGQSPTDGIQAVVVLAEQEIERGPIALLRQFDELLIRPFDGLILEDHRGQDGDLRDADLCQFESKVGEWIVVALVGDSVIGDPQQNRRARGSAGLDPVVVVSVVGDPTDRFAPTGWIA